jgi:NADH-quinone oxidoreductase subunit L
MSLSILVKSGQFGSTTWLKNATFSAPIPASALIHSAALLTAGMFIIIRLQNLFECSELVQNIIISAGLFCAVIYSAKAIFSGAIQEIFAYSSCSQVGLMIAACGFSACGAALILFVSHAFSKSSLLFSTGSVMHALSGERDIRNMGGLFELLPKTYITFVLAAASIIGVPLLPSYYAKKVLLNEIIGSNLSMCNTALVFIIAASILTSVYIFRIIYLIFHGKIKLTETSLSYLNEDENFIINSLYASVFFAIFSGVFFYYALYNDVFWTDVFAFSYAEDGRAVFYFSAVNFVGIIAAALICKSIKSKKFAEFNFEISNETKKFARKLIRSIDTGFYRKCCVFIAGRSREDPADAGR